MPGASFDHLFKIVLVGDSGVGKSNLLSRFTKNVFTLDEKSTIGVEFATRIISMEDGKNIKMQVWDTAGQERYRAITKAYYRGALGALLVYDITQMESFTNVERWLKELKTHSNREIVLIVVGNKKDMADDNPSARQVTSEMATEMGTRLGVQVIEASAKSGENVDKCFVKVAKSIYDASCIQTTGASFTDKSSTQQSQSTGGVNLTKKQEKSGCCK